MVRPRPERPYRVHIRDRGASGDRIIWAPTGHHAARLIRRHPWFWGCSEAVRVWYVQEIPIIEQTTREPHGQAAA